MPLNTKPFNCLVHLFPCFDLRLWCSSFIPLYWLIMLVSLIEPGHNKYICPGVDMCEYFLERLTKGEDLPLGQVSAGGPSIRRLEGGWEPNISWFSLCKCIHLAAASVAAILCCHWMLVDCYSPETFQTFSTSLVHSWAVRGVLSLCREQLSDYLVCVV